MPPRCLPSSRDPGLKSGDKPHTSFFSISTRDCVTSLGETVTRVNGSWDKRLPASPLGPGSGVAFILCKYPPSSWRPASSARRDPRRGLLACLVPRLPSQSFSPPFRSAKPGAECQDHGATSGPVFVAPGGNGTCLSFRNEGHRCTHFSAPTTTPPLGRGREWTLIKDTCHLLLSTRYAPGTCSEFSIDRLSMTTSPQGLDTIGQEGGTGSLKITGNKWG